jgi:histidyl-tRNA synthetase
MSKVLQAVRGMNDILPDDAEVWEQFEDIVRDWLHSYGYRPDPHAHGRADAAVQARHR